MQFTPDDLTWWEWFRKLLGYAAFAATGGVLGHIMRAISKKQKISFVETVFKGLGAGFAGALVALGCQAMKLSLEQTGVIVGVCGWLGAEATIGLLERFIRRKLDIKEKEDGLPKDTD